MVRSISRPEQTGTGGTGPQKLGCPMGRGAGRHLAGSPSRVVCQSSTRRLVQHPKLFFFDVGVWNGLLGNFESRPIASERCSSTWCASSSSTERRQLNVPIRVSTFRTENGAEVDFIVELNRKIGRSSSRLAHGDRYRLTGLRRFADTSGARISRGSGTWGLSAERSAGSTSSLARRSERAWL